jgi:O-antigen/teichoic acid export membrane protein
MALLAVLTKGLAIGKIAILARILSPSQFGSYGIALLVLGFLEVMTETGINIFLIQEKGKIKKYLNSAWVVSILRGTLISILIISLSGIVTKFYQTPSALFPLYLVSAVAFVRGFINPMKVSFQKELEFKKVFAFQLFLYFVDALFAVTLSYLLKNEAGMVMGMLTATIFEVIISFVIFSDRPKLKFEKEKFLEIIHSGKWVTGASAFSYLFQNIDNAVIGKVIGPSGLGLYQQGYSVATIPVTGVSDVYNRVMFPAFVKISDDLNVLKKKFFNSIFVVLLLVSFFGMILFTFAGPIVQIFLGDKWLPIVPTLKILAIFGILKSVVNSSYSLLLSLKMQKAVMLSEFFGILGMGIAIYPMVIKYGLIGAGYSAIIAVMSSMPVALLTVRKIFRNV